MQTQTKVLGLTGWGERQRERDGWDGKSLTGLQMRKASGWRVMEETKEKGKTGYKYMEKVAKKKVDHPKNNQIRHSTEKKKRSHTV